MMMKNETTMDKSMWNPMDVLILTLLFRRLQKILHYPRELNKKYNRIKRTKKEHLGFFKKTLMDGQWNVFAVN